MNKFILSVSAISVLSVAFLSGCAGRSNEINSNAGPDKTSLPGTPLPTTSPANTSAMNTSPAGGDFYSHVAIGGMAEVELGRMASTKAANADVKKFAEMMVTDHSKANEELKALATKKNITLPTSLDSMHQATMQKLQGMSGADFDRAYVDEMVKDHEEDVQMFEKKSGDDSDPDAKAFAAKTLPTLRKHLDSIKQIQSKMK
jgi:putative membrane protein